VQPAESYQQRLAERQAQATRLDRTDSRLANVRFAIFVFTAGIAWWSFASETVSVLWPLVPIIAFVGVAFYHGSVKRMRSHAGRAVEWYSRGLARIEDRWDRKASAGARFEDPHHVYAADLDLFGAGSVFALMSTVRTRMGEDTLAQWLLSPAAVAVVRERQGSVAELRGQLDLREEVTLIGEDDAVGVQPRALIAWAEKPSFWNPRWLRWAAVALPLLAIATAIVWAVWGLISPFALIIAVELLLMRAIRKELHEIVSETERAFDKLGLLLALTRRVERAAFHASGLQTLQQQLLSRDQRASETIAKLATIVQLIESRRNPFLAIFQLPLLYTTNLSLAAERWRIAHGRSVRGWLNALGEIEALLSLAAYSYEHPDDPFPEFVEGAPSFEAAGLGHPLLPAAHCVRNDVTIAGDTKVLLISGSNMSGKSTLLRAIGVNTVLAMAGAPVRAQRLRLTSLQVGASIRVNDSLHEGSSRFYAEITRLRQIHELSGRHPALLFLLDELLQGTNSHDRRIGAQGTIGAFIDNGAIGLITTHDLALTSIGAAIGGRLRNLHFQDELSEGRMSFDFKLREGVVTKSNALELMRSIGLRV
jgi:hypothetical protein